jgi:hypothetical protein
LLCCYISHIGCELRIRRKMQRVPKSCTSSVFISRQFNLVGLNFQSQHATGRGLGPPHVGAKLMEAALKRKSPRASSLLHTYNPDHFTNATTFGRLGHSFTKLTRCKRTQSFKVMVKPYMLYPHGSSHISNAISTPCNIVWLSEHAEFLVS